jgi:cystathionine beta-lyase
MQNMITGLIHHAYLPPEGFAAPQPGVFKASTVIFPNVAAMRQREWKDKTGYTYGLHGTPTTYMLEERLATLEGGVQCLLVPSGLAAIATVALSVLKTGDEVLIPDNAYGPNKALAEGELKDWGITHRFYDAMNPQDLRDKITAQTRLVWVEAAGSVTLEFPDLCELVRICQAKDVLCALDNTWGAGIAFKPFDLVPGAGANLGVDISVHALTKYPSGGGDVLMGSVVTRDPGLHLRLKLTHMRLGLGVAANDAELVLRALPSIVLRYQAHDAATRELARWALGRSEFAQVLHPALPDSPGYAHWQALCDAGGGGIRGHLGRHAGNAAGLFSVIFKPDYATQQVDAFCDALKLFKLGYSWGGPMSLVVPYELASMRQTWPPHLAKGTLVRFSIGLENVDDLQADLTQALDAARTPR